MPRKKFDRSLLPKSPDLEFERALWGRGAAVVAGIDEAGRGALAGPVAAGVVVLPDSKDIQEKLAGVRDSKQMSCKQRAYWFAVIKAVVVEWQVGFGWPEEIDELGIAPATRLAVMRAMTKLERPPDHLLVDWISIPEAGIEETSLAKGDQRSLSIAAASVAAKVTRDVYMEAADAEFPGYGFAAHKGYGTAVHKKAIEALGPSAIHRRSFAPMRNEEERDEEI